MTTRYRKRPIVVDAVRWTGGNIEEIQGFVGPCPDNVSHPGFDVFPERGPMLYVAANRRWVFMDQDEWVIKDSKGCYPCKADVFEATYEPVEETP